MTASIKKGCDYLLAHHIYKQSHDLSRTAKPGWRKLQFPLMYQTDALDGDKSIKSRCRRRPAWQGGRFHGGSSDRPLQDNPGPGDRVHGEQSDYVSQLKALGACDRKYTRAIPGEAASTTDRLRIRDSPDLAARILGYLDTGDHVHILEVTALSFTIDGIDSPWIRIVSGKVEGWVFGGYLSAIMRPWNLAIPELKRIAPITTRSSSRIACSNSSGVRQSFDQEDAP